MSKAGLLTIGNEVVDGQIVNRNAAWLSQELLKIGFEMVSHLSVKDTVEEINRGLNFLSEDCQLIVTTGGLGPTIDDCTRKAISLWVGDELELQGDLWQAIQEKLSGRNVVIRSEHSHQAYVPSQAISLPNRVGVAPGFFSQGKRAAVASLPGPPREIEGIWQDHLKDLLITKLSPRSTEKLCTWICFGAAESEVQNAVKDLFAEQKDVEYGFRLHRPYVELKAWYQDSLETKLQPFFSEVKETLGDWFKGHTISELRSRCIDKLKNSQSVDFYDGLTQGLLLQKLREAGGVPENFTYEIYNLKNPASAEPRNLSASQIAILPIDDTSVDLRINQDTYKISTYRDIPISSQLGKLIIVEKFFLEFPDIKI